MIDLYRLTNASDICTIVGAIPVESSDVSIKQRRTRIFYELLKSTNKLIRFVAGNKAEVEKDFDMIECVVGEKGWLDNAHAMFFSLNPLSPLCYDYEPLESLMVYARRNQPLAIAVCSLSGIFSPFGMSKAEILQNVEILAGMVLVQSITSGLPIIYCPTSARPNFKTASYWRGPRIMLHV